MIGILDTMLQYKTDTILVKTELFAFPLKAITVSFAVPNFGRNSKLSQTASNQTE